MTTLDELTVWLESRGVTCEAVQARLDAAWAAATPTDHAGGRAWYANARAIADDMARSYGISTDTAAGVIAALSPQADWNRNVTNARTLLRLLANSKRIGASGAHRTIRTQPVRHLEMAIEIARSGEPPLDILTGPKRRAFYVNIADPTNPDVVTVDSHMVAIMADVTTPQAARLIGGPRWKRLDGQRSYPWWADELLQAASRHHMLANQFQAIVWLARARTWQYKTETSANGADVAA